MSEPKDSAAAAAAIDAGAEAADLIQEKVKKAKADAAAAAREFSEKVRPHLQTELDKLHEQHPETAEITLEDLIFCADFLDRMRMTANERMFFYAAYSEAGHENDPEPLRRNFLLALDAAGKACETLAADEADEKTPRRYTQTIKPNRYSFTVDNVSRQVFEGLLHGYDPRTGNLWKIPMTDAKTGVYVYASIFFYDSETDKELDINDKELLDFVCSFMREGNTSISLCCILEKSGNPRPTAKQIDAAYRRLLKMKNAYITMDCKKWAQMKKKDVYSIYKRGILDGIMFEEIRNEKNGELLDVILHCAYTVEQLPLYYFAEMNGQIASMPMHSAMITGNNSITEKTGAIRHVLRERIARKHKNNKSGKVVKLETIYEKINAESKMEKSRAREQIKNFMLEWIKDGLLYGFAFRKKGKGFDAVVFARTKAEMNEANKENDGLTEWYHR